MAALVSFFSISTPGSCDDLLDDESLGIGVILDILPFLPGQSQLSACVQITISGIASQPVPEHQYAVDFRTAGREYVQVNFGVPPVEHPVFEPVGLADTKHVAGASTLADLLRKSFLTKGAQHWSAYFCTRVSSPNSRCVLSVDALLPAAYVAHSYTPVSRVNLAFWTTFSCSRSLDSLQAFISNPRLLQNVGRF